MLKRAEVQFDFIQEIGHHGQNSRTFIAHDHQLGARIVIKEMAKVRLDSGRFFREAQALYASAHPNVVQIHYACEDNDNVYVAMPHYANRSLKDLINTRFLTVREIITIGCEVLSGLQNVHSKGLVHFDIKPDNVLISDRGEGLLSDFGLARPIDGRGLAEFDIGYLRTRPPEAFRDGEFPRTFDIYQVGSLLYRMCCGNAEFEQQFERFVPGGVFDRNAFRVAVANSQFPDVNKFPAHIPERLRAVVRKCLQVSPADRYPSALEVANALALIDGPTLDWRYSELNAEKLWSKNEGGTHWEFKHLGTGETVCYKTVNGGQRRRYGAGCQNRMTERQVRTFLGNT